MPVVITKKKSFLFKPQQIGLIDRDHPLAERLVFCCPFNRPGLRMVDVAKTIRRPATNLTSYRNSGRYGLLARGGSWGNADTTDMDFASGPFTVAAFFNIDHTITNGVFTSPLRRYHDNGAPDNRGWGLFAYPPDSTNLFNFDCKNNTGTDASLNSITSVSTGNWFIVGTSDGTTRKIYVNGKFEASTTLIPNPITNPTDTLATSSDSGNVLSYITYAWNRCLSPNNIGDLNENKYLLFQKPRRKTYFFPTAVSSAVNSTATPAKATITILVNTPTANASKSSTATPALKTVSIVVNAPAASIVKSSTATPGLLTITIKVNQATGSTSSSKNSTATPVLATISIQVKSPVGAVSKSSTATPTKVTISVITFGVTATVSKSAAATPAGSAIRITVNVPTASVKASRTVSPSTVNMTIVVLNPSATVSGAASGITITILLRSQIEKKILSNSRIEKYLNQPSRIEKILTMKSAI